jgi:hypothetical protein
MGPAKTFPQAQDWLSQPAHVSPRQRAQWRTDPATAYQEVQA